MNREVELMRQISGAARNEDKAVVETNGKAPVRRVTKTEVSAVD